jgi:uncharacterized membrane protein (TIGR02234 family)
VIRGAQLLFIAAAAGLWLASRLAWVTVSSFDGLGRPKTATLSGASWSTALIPLALLLAAAAVAALAVRGWPLRILALLVATASGGMGYLAVSLWVIRDVSVRAAELAQIPVAQLVGVQRQHWGAGITVAAAVASLAGAVLLMRSASGGRPAAKKYLAPAERRAGVTAGADVATGTNSDTGAATSERTIWDALDDGRDPTNPDTEGR